MNESQPSEPDSLFLRLVSMFGATAMQHLGKWPDSGAGPAEIDLPGARFAIDMLEMIESRTRGNLTGPESRALGDTLTALRLEYVRAADGSPPTPPPSSPQPPPPEPGKGDAAPDPPRFHKSYG